TRDLFLARQPQLAEGARDRRKAARAAEVRGTLLERGVGLLGDELTEPLEVLRREHGRIPPAVGPRFDRAAAAVQLQQPGDESDADQEPFSDLANGPFATLNRIDDALSEILGVGSHRSPPLQDLHSNGAPSN